MNISCITIDNNLEDLKVLNSFIDKINYLNLIDSFDHLLDALDFLRSNMVKLIFVNVEMDMLTGFDFIGFLSYNPIIIITSKDKSYALDAFEIGALDYLVKPIAFNRLLASTEKIFNFIDINMKNNLKINCSERNKIEDSGRFEYNDCMYVKSGSKLVNISFNSIYYIRGMRDYLMIRTSNQRIMTLLNFNKIIHLLNHNFIRVHKSYIISLEKIEFIERNRIKIFDCTIPISNTYKLNFYESLKKQNISNI